MDAEEHPRQISATRPLRGHASDHRSAARAAVHLRVSQEVALSLKAQAERRGDNRLSHHRQMMPGVVKAQRETNDQHSRSHFYLVQLLYQMIGCKRLEEELLRQRRALKLQSDDVHHAGWIDTLPPHGLGSSVKRDGEMSCDRHVLRINMELDFQAVRTMIARLVQHHVSIRHKKQPAIPLEKEAGGVGQLLFS